MIRPEPTLQSLAHRVEHGDSLAMQELTEILSERLRPIVRRALRHPGGTAPIEQQLQGFFGQNKLGASGPFPIAQRVARAVCDSLRHQALARSPALDPRETVLV